MLKAYNIHLRDKKSNKSSHQQRDKRKDDYRIGTWVVRPNQAPVDKSNDSAVNKSSTDGKIEPFRCFKCGLIGHNGRSLRLLVIIKSVETIYLFMYCNGK